MSKPKKIKINGKPYFAWEYEEQTQIKHQVLQAYSKIWIAKLGNKSNTIFFDCHGGCGAYMKPDGSVHFGSSIIVNEVGFLVNKNRKYKTGVFYCEVEKDNAENFSKILKEINEKYIVVKNKPFEEVINTPQIKEYYQKYPSLFLVDPFGYNFSISELSNLMDSFGNEIILNFMFDYIRRFISVPNLESNFNRFFGSEEWKQAINLNGHQRETFLVDLFVRRFKTVTNAKYVFPYRLCYPSKNATYYYLIHATNHIDGITYMKDVFSGINNGRVEYLGKSNKDLTLFDLSSYKAGDLYSSYLIHYKGRSITFEMLWSEIVEDTAYTAKDLSDSIKELEKEKKLSVTRVSSKRMSYREQDIINVL